MPELFRTSEQESFETKGLNRLKRKPMGSSVYSILGGPQDKSGGKQAGLDLYPDI